MTLSKITVNKWLQITWVKISTCNKMKNKEYHTVSTVPKYHTVSTVLKYNTVSTVPKYHTVSTVLKYNTVSTV